MILYRICLFKAKSKYILTLCLKGSALVSICQNDFGFSSFLVSESKFHRVKCNSIRTKRKQRITDDVK